MPELCDKCDNLKRDGSCKICSREEQEYFISKDLCNFASIKGHSVTMESHRYYRARSWHEKGKTNKVEA